MRAPPRQIFGPAAGKRTQLRRLVPAPDAEQRRCRDPVGAALLLLGVLVTLGRRRRR